MRRFLDNHSVILSHHHCRQNYIFIPTLKGGEFLVKKDYNPVTQEIIPRKYFSGGVKLHGRQSPISEDGILEIFKNPARFKRLKDGVKLVFGLNKIAPPIGFDSGAEARAPVFKITPGFEGALKVKDKGMLGRLNPLRKKTKSKIISSLALITISTLALFTGTGIHFKKYIGGLDMDLLDIDNLRKRSSVYNQYLTDSLMNRPLIISFTSEFGKFMDEKFDYLKNELPVIYSHILKDNMVIMEDTTGEKTLNKNILSDSGKKLFHFPSSFARPGRSPNEIAAMIVHEYTHLRQKETLLSPDAEKYQILLTEYETFLVQLLTYYKLSPQPDMDKIMDIYQGMLWDNRVMGHIGKLLPLPIRYALVYRMSLVRAGEFHEFVDALRLISERHGIKLRADDWNSMVRNSYQVRDYFSDPDNLMDTDKPETTEIISVFVDSFIEGIENGLRDKYPDFSKITEQDILGYDGNYLTYEPLSLDRRGGDSDNSHDRAMVGVKKNTGGIDFNPAIGNTTIQREGSGISVPISNGPVGNMGIDGFVPVIINVIPIKSILPLLGLDTIEPKKEKHITSRNEPMIEDDQSWQDKFSTAALSQKIC
ncbi:MAG: hypothetical protein KAR05_03270 [Candidatus Omnitrophica bacterium]|nr:hypothetical protein [Candidatus Omnitrophota bacterium]